MSVTVYNPTGIVHSITVDIGNVRSIPAVVKLTQYDNTLPTIAVKLTNGNQTYKIPEAANVSIRVGKPDNTGVYNPCLGVSSDYTTVYFAATEQMCAVAGTLSAIVEVVTAEGTAGTGVFAIKVSENPVNDDTKLSESEIAVFQKIADDAQKAAASISQFETDLSNTMKQSQKAEETANSALSTANTAKATADSAANTASDAKQTAETTDARLSSIIADGQQTEGNTELIDIRTAYDGALSKTAGDSVRRQFENLMYYAGLAETSTETFFDENYISITPSVIYDNCTLSGLDNSNGKYQNAIIDNGGILTNKVYVVPVQSGVKYKIVGDSINNSYIGLGAVFVNSDTLPVQYSTGKKYAILSGYDYYLGNTENAWRRKTYDVVAPQGSTYCLIQRFASFDDTNNPVSIKINKPTSEDSKIVFSDEFETLKNEVDSIAGNNNDFVKNTVFNFTEPAVTTGTTKSTKVYSRFNRPSIEWDFSEVGTITFENIKVNAKESDKVGFWMYINAVACDYANNTDGTLKIYVDGIQDGNDINIAYNYAPGWNYVPVTIKDNSTHTLAITFTLVRGNYVVSFDTLEINYVPQVKPQILLSFDMSSHATGNVCKDNRYKLIHNHGFVATFCNPDDTNISQADLNKVFSEGWDWAMYNGNTTSIQRPDWATGTVEEWKEYLNTRFETCAKIGLFEPFSYFSPNNRLTPNLEIALKELGFKVARIAGSETAATNIIWFNDYNNLYIHCFGVGGSATAESIIQKIDTAIANNSSICIFTHNVEDALTDEMNCTVEVYSAILDAIQERVDNGLCEVSTFTEFFRKWCPEECAKKLELRHEKEKQYILGKINNN